MWKWILGVLIIVIVAVNLKSCASSEKVQDRAPAVSVVEFKGPLPVLAQNAVVSADPVQLPGPPQHEESGENELQAVEEEERQLMGPVTD